MPKIIHLPIYNIKITLTPDSEDDGKIVYSGEITSDLHDGDSGNENDGDYDAQIDGIERLILAMACEGIDLETPAMFSAIETAVEAVANAEL